MKLSPQMRNALLALDALALSGVVVFSVLSALERDESVYVIGQIICVVIVLGSVLLLHRDHQFPGGA